MADFTNGYPWAFQPFNETQTAVLGSWTAGTALPDDLYNHGAIVTNSKVFLIGGYTNAGGVQDTVYVASIDGSGVIGSWSASTALPGPRSEHSCFMTKDRVYIVGGRYGDGEAPLASTYYADIAVDGTLGTWTAGPTLPNAIIGHKTIVTKNRVYVIGGGNGDVILYDVYYANIDSSGVLGSWSTGTDVTINVEWASATTIGNRAYIFGIADGLSDRKDVYHAAIDTSGNLGTFTLAFSLSTEVSNPAIFYTDARIWVVDSNFTVHTAPLSSGIPGTWTTDTAVTYSAVGIPVVITSTRAYLLHENVEYVSFSGGLNNYTDSTYTEPETVEFEGSIVAPTPTISGLIPNDIDGSIEVTLPSISGVMSNPVVLQGSITCYKPEVSGSLFTPVNFAGNIVAKKPRIDGDMGWMGSVVSGKTAISGTFVTEFLFSGGVEAKMVRISGTLSTPYTMSGDLSFPKPKITGTLSTPIFVATGNIKVKLPSISGTLNSPVQFVGNISVHTPRISGSVRTAKTPTLLSYIKGIFCK